MRCLITSMWGWCGIWVIYGGRGFFGIQIPPGRCVLVVSSVAAVASTTSYITTVTFVSSSGHTYILSCADFSTSTVGVH